MDALSFKTISANNQTAKHDWYVIDATDLVVGRICSRIAHVLRGKHKPNFTPHVDTGDYVIVINADKLRFTGQKADQKTYLDYSLYPGGQKATVAKNEKPTRVVERAVKGMLPKTKLGRAMYKKLFVYAGPEHKHQAQQPKEFNF